MQFRIAARKPAQITIGRRRLVSEWRKWGDLGAGRAPALHEMRIDERERGVARERDALSRRPNRDGRPQGQTAIAGASQCKNTAAIDMRLNEICDRLEPRFKRVRLAGR